MARLIILGEAPPPERFFFYGDSLFLRYLRRAFFPLLPEAETKGADWFLAYFRALGGWRTDVCDAPQRRAKGGADDVSGCMEEFLRRWEAQPRDPEAIRIVSPKRLIAELPETVRSAGVFGVPPPGQWNAHRQAFLREVGGLLERYIGRDELRRVAGTVDPDDAALDFEIARTCAEGADADEIRRLLKGHPREAALRAVWEAKG